MEYDRGEAYEKDDIVRVQTRLKEIGYLNKQINILQDLEGMYF
ncbi:hypothetical protein [uncultured Veillonella sp.]|nr:hypothetical protein [uncultured Veillonella sp.]